MRQLTKEANEIKIKTKTKNQELLIRLKES